MVNKYNIPISPSSLVTNITRLTNQIWKLIPMKENDEDYTKQINTVLIEIAGLSEFFYETPQFLQIISKLEGLKIESDIDFFLYRKTVFEIINLLQEVKNGKTIL